MWRGYPWHIGTIQNNWNMLDIILLCWQIVSAQSWTVVWEQGDWFDFTLIWKWKEGYFVWTWNNIVLQDLVELLSDVVLAHAVLQSQVELVGAVQHLVAGVLLGPGGDSQTIRGDSLILTCHTSESHRLHKHQLEYVWTTTSPSSPWVMQWFKQRNRNMNYNDKGYWPVAFSVTIWHKLSH